MPIWQRVRIPFATKLVSCVVWANLVQVSAQTYLFNQAGLGVGNKPVAIAVADFNADGRLDIAVVNQTDNTVSILLNVPSGGFASKVDYKVGTSPTALVVADFNGDRIPDLAVVNSHDDTVSILLGAGAGKFKSEVTYSTETTPVAIVAADVNGDHKTDLAIANQGSSNVSILLGRGDGTFEPQSVVPTVSNPSWVASGDFNKDGKVDLAVLNPQGDLALLLNNGKGGFTAASELSIGPSVGGMVVGDVNRDGNLDIVATNPIGQQLVTLLGNGSGGFKTLYTPPNVNVTPATVNLGDFNGDGKLDLAVANSYPASISILLGNGDGTYGTPFNFGFAGSALPAGNALPIAIGDFNNDNHLDLAAIDDNDNEVVIFLGSGNGRIGGETESTLPSSEGVAGSVAADFNGEKKIDVAIAQFDENLSLVTGFITTLLGNGNGTFHQPIATTVPEIGIDQMVAGDFNGDGKMDVATAFVESTGNIAVALGNGNGTFSTPSQAPVNLKLSVQNIVAGDFNNDGKTDLALLSLDSSNTFTSLYVLLSNGDGTFRPLLVENVPGIAGFLTAGDFNHDGKLDLVVPIGGSVLVFLGRGNGTFESPISNGAGSAGAGDVRAADFNSDGKLDLAAGNEQGIAFFAGNGDGTFKAPVLTPTSFPVLFIDVGDFNGDGKPDLTLIGSQGYKTVALGNGNGTFKPPLAFEPFFLKPAFPPIGDFNHDGSSDLMQFSQIPGTVPIMVTAAVWSSAPSVVFSHSSIAFGSQKVGTSSSPHSVTLTNTGNAPLSIVKSTVVGEFSETNNCGSKVAVGGVCTINVTFTPTSTGPSTGKLTITNNAAGGWQVINLKGSGS